MTAPFYSNAMLREINEGVEKIRSQQCSGDGAKRDIALYCLQ